MIDPALGSSSRLIVLDSEPLGLLVKDPKAVSDPEAARCVDWVFSLIEKGDVVTIPEIVRYELRRELVLRTFRESLNRLDRFCGEPLAFLPITGDALDLASELWADVRRRGLSTADDKRLDVDVILAAQTLRESRLHGWPQAIIATKNVGHLPRFRDVDARRWQDIL